jgi:hypothetical protein
MMDVLRRRDRANDGVGIAGALKMFEQFRPDLSRSQITNAFAHTIRPRHKEDITNRTAKQGNTKQGQDKTRQSKTNKNTLVTKPCYY